MSLLSSKRRRGWYVEAAGRVWGPYAERRLEDFVSEGRIGPATLVAPSPDGPFQEAAARPDLAHLFPRAAGPAPQPQPTAAPQPIPLRPVAAPVQTAPVAIAAQSAVPVAAGAGRPLLVWASVGPAGLEPFEQLLAIHGPQVRLGPGLWLVRARMPAAGLRNALTRRLRGAEALLVVEASMADAAWFNLDGEVDRAARDLWIES